MLLTIQRKEQGWESWRERLMSAAAEGPLLICPVVFAECSLGYASAEEAVMEFESIGLYYDPIQPRSAFLAGKIFLRYRNEGGVRETLLPDFLIAAHATLQADRLAAVDRGYLRRYFSELQLL